MTERYKGFYLRAGANELQFDLGYSPWLTVRRHQGNSVTAAEITSVRGVYATKGEAIQSALAHGRQGIDRGFRLDCPNCR